MAQTSYDQNFDKFQEGQVVDTSVRTVDSFQAEEVIGFGKAVERGTDKDKQVVAFDGGDFLGVTIFTHNKIDGEYKENDTVGVLTKGRIAVDVGEVEVEAGETAYVVDATGAFTNDDSDATECGVFLTSGTGLQALQVK